MIRLLRSVFLGLLLVMTVGCAALYQQPPSAPGIMKKTHNRWVRSVQSWRFWGRFGLVFHQRGSSGTLYWKTKGNRYLIQVGGPLGRTVAQISGHSNEVVFCESGKRPRKARSAQLLMRQALGWSLPVAGLRYWVRGIPDPRYRVVKDRVDESGRLIALEQSGWRITFSHYNALGSRAFPKRIVLRRKGIRLILLIDRWSY